MVAKETITKILWSTIEDYVGLWQILWELNSLFPENNEELNKIIAIRILRYFLDRELVTLYYERWGEDDLEEISYNKAKTIINQDTFWMAPNLNEICIKVGNTEKGKEYYNDGLVECLPF